MKLFALAGSRPFAERVARAAGVPIAAHEERDFGDGEHKIRPLEGVRGEDAFVVSVLHGMRERGVNEQLIRTLFLVGALKDAGAASVTAVLPCLAYARKDRRTKARDPLSLRYLASMVEAVGTDCVLTVDVHNLAAFQNAFRCRTEHLEAAALFARHFAHRLGDAGVTVMSPDAGGMKRAERFRVALEHALGRPVGAGFTEKYRSEGDLSGSLFAGDVEGRTVIVYDDLIASGGTLKRTAEPCIARGAVRVLAAATHGLFVPPASETLDDGVIERVAVADTVPVDTHPREWVERRVEVVSVADLVAEALRRLTTGGSVSELRQV
jgi:ribose-phosphate pyrophosphokinase